MSARRRRTTRGEQRRRLGQNFLSPDVADELADAARLSPGELVVEIGPGAGAITAALASRGARVLAVEVDLHWAERLRRRFAHAANVRIVRSDVLTFPLPREPFRVVASVPFGRTTAILRHLLNDPASGLERCDLVLQWEVARKRAAAPPTTLLSTAWAPWWTFELGARIPAGAFRPVPRVDAGVLVIRRRNPPLLPQAMAGDYHRFVEQGWPFSRRRAPCPRRQSSRASQRR